MIYPNDKNPIHEKITIRKPLTKLNESIPIHWLDGNIFKTHIGNALSIIFPNTENYFVNTIKKFLPVIRNPRLNRDIQSFIGQEIQHKGQHENIWELLESQGFVISNFVKVYEFFILRTWQSIIPDELNLSIIAGIEHFNTIFAEISIEEDLFKNSDPNMKEIFEWHLAEELEHKNVAYDVLQEVNDSYFLRLQGMIIAYILIMTAMGSANLHLLLQEDPRNWQRIFKEGKDFLFVRDKISMKLFSRFIDYFKPEFHPAQSKTHHLVDKIILSMKFEPILNKNAANSINSTRENIS
ncbi:metal-dependent hydrolase [Leptospira sp. GIMC2001]|uniref:metal-dependent hydrolase n=1 Tax=Leptospira sp. GIMC2001 TaxID=1513297 RepID=UPI00234AEAA0|nr:metal-dependent hydrolase [Leptospira sp. GIMC2001]WCL49418.1 metal-dependent hydrolase [Leptospira sp. GIMC2001]